MSEEYKINSTTGNLDKIGQSAADVTSNDARYLKLDQTTPQTVTGDGSIIGLIPQLTSDPASPDAETAWVLRSGTGGAIADGTPIGLLLSLTYTGNAGVAFTYAFKYRTKENTTLSVALT